MNNLVNNIRLEANSNVFGDNFGLFLVLKSAESDGLRLALFEH